MTRREAEAHVGKLVMNCNTGTRHGRGGYRLCRIVSVHPRKDYAVIRPTGGHGKDERADIGDLKVWRKADHKLAEVTS